MHGRSCDAALGAGASAGWASGAAIVRDAPRTLTTSLGPTTWTCRGRGCGRRRGRPSGGVRLVPPLSARGRLGWMKRSWGCIWRAATAGGLRRVGAAAARRAAVEGRGVAAVAGWPRTSRRGRPETWPTTEIRYLFLDGWYPKVRFGKRRVRVPVLGDAGRPGDGQRVVLDLRLGRRRERGSLARRHAASAPVISGPRRSP